MYQFMLNYEMLGGDEDAKKTITGWQGFKFENSYVSRRKRTVSFICRKTLSDDERSHLSGIGSSLCAGGSKRSPKLIWSFFGVYFSFSGTETTKNKHKFELKLSIQAS